jgi:ribosome-associated protein
MVLIFDVATSQGIDDAEKLLLQTKLKTKISQENLLILTCDEDRSQLKNKRIIIKRFFEMLEKALVKPKKRIATKSTKGANERRIQEKKKAGEIKSGRKKLDF